MRVAAAVELTKGERRRLAGWGVGPEHVGTVAGEGEDGADGGGGQDEQGDSGGTGGR